MMCELDLDLDIDIDIDTLSELLFFFCNTHILYSHYHHQGLGSILALDSQNSKVLTLLYCIILQMQMKICCSRYVYGKKIAINFWCHCFMGFVLLTCDLIPNDGDFMLSSYELYKLEVELMEHM